MRKLIKALLLVCFLPAGISSLQAQSYKDDLLQIVKTMNASQKYSVTINYHMYRDKEVLPYESSTVSFCRDHENYYVNQNGDMEYTASQNCDVMIDHRQKQVLLSSRMSAAKGDTKEFMGLFEIKIDSIVQASFIKINYTEQAGGLGKYECFPKYGEYEKIEIVFDKKQHLILKTRFYFREPVKDDSEKGAKAHKMILETVYQNFNANAPFTKSTFSLNRYFKIFKGKQIILNDKYSTYELINLNGTYEN